MFARARQRSVFFPRDGYILELPKITFLIIIKIVQFACHAQLIKNILWSTFMSSNSFILLVHYQEVQELVSAVFSSSGLMN